MGAVNFLRKGQMDHVDDTAAGTGGQTLGWDKAIAFDKSMECNGDNGLSNRT